MGNVLPLPGPARFEPGQLVSGAEGVFVVSCIAFENHIVVKFKSILRQFWCDFGTFGATLDGFGTI